LGTIALVVPAAFASAAGGAPGGRELIESEFVAVLLLGSYVLRMLFSLRTHARLYEDESLDVAHGEVWSVRKSVLVLAAATIGVAVMAETLVESVEGVTHALGWSELFVG